MIKRTDNPEIAYVGSTANLNAEYGVECDKPFAIALFYNDEPVSVEGYNTVGDCVAGAETYDCAQIFMLANI